MSDVLFGVLAAIGAVACGLAVWWLSERSARFDSEIDQALALLHPHRPSCWCGDESPRGEPWTHTRRSCGPSREWVS